MSLLWFISFTVFASVESPITKTGPALLPWDIKSSGSATHEVSFEAVQKSVEKHLPLTEVAKKQIEIAEGREMAAKGAFDFRLQAQVGVLTETYNQRTWEAQLTRQIDGTPVELYGGWRRGQGDFRSYEGKSLTGTEGEIRGGVKVSLLRDFLADPARTRRTVTKNLHLAAQEEAKFRILELKRMASDRYWEWVGATLQLEGILRLYRLAEDRLSQVQRRAKAGISAKIEVVEIERMIAQRKSQLIDAERLYQRSVLELSLYYRDDSGNPKLNISLPKNFDIQSIAAQESTIVKTEYAIQNSLDLRGDFRSLNQQYLASEAELKLSKNQILPRVDAQLEYATDHGSPKDGEKELRGLITLSFPLENRESRGNLVSSQARLDQIEQSKSFLKDQLTQEVTNVYSAVQAAYKKAKVMLQDRDLSEQLAQAERKRFEDGLSSLLIVNIREQTANDSLIRALDSVIEYEKVKVRYKVAQGLEPI